MRILLSSHLFSPSVGGLETVSRLLALRFHELGHSVTVVTQTVADNVESWPFPVVRCPGKHQLLDLVRWSEVFFHNNISLKMCWPLLLVRRPWVVAHHIWIARPAGGRNWQDWLKRGAIRRATNVAISRAIADDLPCPSVVIGDPYDESIFHLKPPVIRDVPLAFLGRLVSDKGVDVLLEALARLRAGGLAPELHIIGQGTELEKLSDLAGRLGLARQVKFLGLKTGLELASYLQRVQTLVIPSRWAEPFGVVALEGMACGCLVVGSEAGGLKDAIGPAGVTVPNGDSSALAEVLRQVLEHRDRFDTCRTAAPAHLKKHRSVSIARQYLDLFERLCTRDFAR